MDNPFIIITSTGNEDVVDRVEERVDIQMRINRLINNGGFLLVTGEPGVGKSTIINWVVNDVRKKSDIDLIYEVFGVAALSKLKGACKTHNKRLLIILDDFNNIDMLSSSQQKDTVNIINDLAKNGIGIVAIDNRKDNKTNYLNGLITENSIMNIKGMKDEDIKKIIINRLNEVRKTKSNDFYPFSDEEIEKILKKARGNPRTVLLICAALFDAKQTSLI